MTPALPMTAVLNRKGLTLVEVLVALVVLLFVSLAMMQTALVSIESNMKNILRDEAGGVAEARMNEARNLAFTGAVDNLLSDTDTLEPITDDNFNLPDAADWSECICKTGEGCTVGQPDKGPYPVRVRKNIRNVEAFDFATRRVVNALDTDNREVKIVVRRVYKDKCYSQVLSTIVRKQ